MSAHCPVCLGSKSAVCPCCEGYWDDCETCGGPCLSCHGGVVDCQNCLGTGKPHVLENLQ